MKTPSKNSVLAVTTAMLLSSGSYAEAALKAEDRPVPAVPADVLEKGGDAVLDWMLKEGYLTPDYLRQFTQGKAAAVTEGAETPDANPLLMKLKEGFDSLPDTAFKVGVKPKWEVVAKKLTPDVLVKANHLENPKIYGVNDKGQLVIGDGGQEVPEFTLGQNYLQARGAAKVAGLSLMTEAEYGAFSNGTMELQKITWLESGDTPFLALGGSWFSYTYVRVFVPERSDENHGARRVLRVQL